MANHDVVIAGAGIGGLAAALCIARRGFRVAVQERSDVPLEAGAGIQLGPNVTRILGGMGLLEAVTETASRPEAIRIRDGMTGRNLAAIPLGQKAEVRYGAPYLVVHRGDLHRILHNAAASHPRIDVTHGWEAIDFEQSETGIVLTERGGRHVEGRVLIGADGLRSRIRHKVLKDGAGMPSGHIAWRTLIPINQAPEKLRRAETGLWIAPEGHVVHYPVRADTMLNIVAIVPGETDARGWSADGDPAVLLNALRNWAAPVIDLVGRAAEWRYWPLFDRPPSHNWGQGQVTLLGDAAHPMLPFLAQGGAMAIEDAAVLADCLAADLNLPERALTRYEDLRRDRTAKVQAASRENARTFHLDGGMRRARNLVLRLANLFAPTKPLERYDWLYGYDATKAVDAKPRILT